MSNSPKLQGLNPLHLLGSAAIGAGLAVVIQAWLSSRGRPPIVPPYSMAVTLAALAILLIVLGLRLRRNMRKGVGAVNPFQAVRLLATARAGQIVGAVFSGVAAGLLMSLIGRSVPAPTSTWLPMLVTGLAALALLACAVIAERLCRVPPGGEDPSGPEDTGLATLET